MFGNKPWKNEEHAVMSPTLVVRHATVIIKPKNGTIWSEIIG